MASPSGSTSASGAQPSVQPDVPPNTQPNTTPDLTERYGAPRPGRRRLALGVLAAVVVGFAAWLVWATWFHSTPSVRSELVGWAVLDDHEVTANVAVELGDGVRASCRVRAIAEDHTPVGELAFEPVGGRNEVSVRTERAATAVTLLGCTTEGQPRPR